jgi:predicted RNase H-like HicB family nuclease
MAYPQHVEDASVEIEIPVSSARRRSHAGVRCVVKPVKLLRRLLGGAVRNVAFRDMRVLVEASGFRLSRVSGSHHIFDHPDVPVLLNLQEVGGEAKPYQIRQKTRRHDGLPLLPDLHVVPPPRGAVQSQGARPLMRDYHINIFYSEEDGGYVADIPDLEACSAFGETPELALKALREAKDAWIAAAREAGKPIPPPRYRPAIYQATD